MALQLCYSRARQNILCRSIQNVWYAIHASSAEFCLSSLSFFRFKQASPRSMSSTYVNSKQIWWTTCQREIPRLGELTARSSTLCARDVRGLRKPLPSERESPQAFAVHSNSGSITEKGNSVFMYVSSVLTRWLKRGNGRPFLFIEIAVPVDHMVASMLFLSLQCTIFRLYQTHFEWYGHAPSQPE